MSDKWLSHVKEVLKKIDKKELIYYGAVVIGVIFIIGSVWNQPKRYKSTKDWLQATDKSIPILKTMGDNSLGTFCPPSTNREFWDNIPTKPHRIPPPEAEALASFNEIGILREGTKQECFYPDGEWIPEIERALRKLLTKDTHDTELFKKPLVDLIRTETGAIMANCIGLIGHKLNPDLVEEIKIELKKTIIEPYKKDLQLSQMKRMRFGYDSCPWIGNPGNWNAVCTANILYIAMVILEDKKEVASLIAESQKNIETYLKSYEEDGYLSEGMRYWSYGFSHFILLSEILLKITNGETNLYEIPKIKNIIEFPLKAKIGENLNLNFEYFPLFTDNSNPIRDAKNNFEWYLLSKRAELPFNVSSPTKHHYSDTKLDLLLNIPATKDTFVPIVIDPPSDPIYFKSAGMLLSKWVGGNEVLAIKGGSNSEDHNHNDIGSYTLFTKVQFGEMLPVTGDLGDIEYTQENIGTYRYKFDLLSSYGHPVPIVDNQLQNNSPDARAKVLLAKVDKEEDKIVYDILTAYDVAGLKTLKREVISKKTGNQSLTVIDNFESSRPINFESPLIFPGVPEKISENIYQMTIIDNSFTIEISSTDPVVTEIIPLDKTGYRVTKRGNPKKLGDPHKLSIKLKNKNLKGNISYRISKVNKINKPLPKKSIPPAMIPSTPTNTNQPSRLTTDLPQPEGNNITNTNTSLWEKDNAINTPNSPKVNMLEIQDKTEIPSSLFNTEINAEISSKLNQTTPFDAPMLPNTGTTNFNLWRTD